MAFWLKKKILSTETCESTTLLTDIRAELGLLSLAEPLMLLVSKDASKLTACMWKLSIELEKEPSPIPQFCSKAFPSFNASNMYVSLDKAILGAVVLLENVSKIDCTLVFEKLMNQEILDQSIENYVYFTGSFKTNLKTFAFSVGSEDALMEIPNILDDGVKEKVQGLLEDVRYESGLFDIGHRDVLLGRKCDPIAGVVDVSGPPLKITKDYLDSLLNPPDLKRKLLKVSNGITKFKKTLNTTSSNVIASNVLEDLESLANDKDQYDELDKIKTRKKTLRRVAFDHISQRFREKFGSHAVIFVGDYVPSTLNGNGSIGSLNFVLHTLFNMKGYYVCKWPENNSSKRCPFCLESLHQHVLRGPLGTQDDYGILDYGLDIAMEYNDYNEGNNYEPLSEDMNSMDESSTETDCSLFSMDSENIVPNSDSRLISLSRLHLNEKGRRKGVVWGSKRCYSVQCMSEMERLHLQSNEECAQGSCVHPFRFRTGCRDQFAVGCGCIIVHHILIHGVEHPKFMKSEWVNVQFSLPVSKDQICVMEQLTRAGPTSQNWK